MHAEGFTHRDLKPQNIFVVSKSPKWSVKLGDFGISKRVDPTQTALRTEIGTPLYMAPEIIQDDWEDESKTYTSKVDIWSLGCVVYHLLAMQPPFSSRKTKREAFPRDPLEHRIEPCGMSFLEALLMLDPAERMTAEHALRDPWLQSQSVETTDLPVTPSTKQTIPGVWKEGPRIKGVTTAILTAAGQTLHERKSPRVLQKPIRAYVLERHANLHAPPRTYTCPYSWCQRSQLQQPFSRQDHLDEHLRSIHMKVFTKKTKNKKRSQK